MPDDTPMTAADSQLHGDFVALASALSAAVLGQERLVERLLIALLADGHLLVEGAPGLAKTTAVKALANRIDADFQRIQFTPDLLPADLTGTEIWQQAEAQFAFQPGPVFHNLLLADEINRAPPRTQSALLEAMAEHQITVDGVCHRLQQPFFVIATQNPVDLVGTFPLPDSQLDRFLLRIQLGYPDATAERAMLIGEDRRHLIEQAQPLLDAEQLLALRRAVSGIHASTALIDYIQALLAHSRRYPGVRVGLSPRAGLALLRAAKAHALLCGREHVLPEDVQRVFVEVSAHRLATEGHSGEHTALASAMLADVAVD